MDWSHLFVPKSNPKDQFYVRSRLYSIVEKVLVIVYSTINFFVLVLVQVTYKEQL